MRGASVVKIVMSSPTFTFALSAVFLSIATWSCVVGPAPSTTWNTVSSESGWNANPNVGAPCPGLPTALPLLPTTCA